MTTTTTMLILLNFCPHCFQRAAIYRIDGSGCLLTDDAAEFLCGSRQKTDGHIEQSWDCRETEKRIKAHFEGKA
jgi:hypothetical protein